RNAQPWVNPALGARTAWSSIRSTAAGSTASGAKLRTIRRRRTTSANSMRALSRATLTPPRRAAGLGRMPADPAQPSFEEMWRELLPIGRSARSGGYFRPAYGAAELECRAWLVAQAERRGLDTSPDGNGILHARCAPPTATGPAVLTGSHLDSVPDGGAFDGPLGVVSAFAALDRLRAAGVAPARPLVIAAFPEEEGSRFGVACLGSRLATGML